MKRPFLLIALILLAIPAYSQVSRGREFRCTVTVSTATTLTAVGGDCAAQTGGLSHYITDILASTTVISSTAADAMPTLKYGTGTTCGTGTTVFWLAQALAATTVVQGFQTPIKIPAGNDICWINSPAGTKSWVITGYIAP